MIRRTRSQYQNVVVAAVIVATVALLAPGPSTADVSAVRGEAFGVSADVTIFGSTTNVSPTPAVALPPGGSATPVEASQPSIAIFAGPNDEAVVFSALTLDVSTVGTPGPSGSVTSTASVNGINQSDSEVLTASNITSTCSASEAGGVTGSTTVTGGVFFTDMGDDNNLNSIANHLPTSVAVPGTPDPNFELAGHLHIGNGTDTYRYVFNEQTVLPDGSLRVRAVHAFLEGPTAVGELIVGEVICGVTVVATTTTTTQVAPTTTTTLVAPTTTTTVVGPTTTTTQVAPTTTTTVVGPTTTTTQVAPTTTTTVVGPTTTTTQVAPPPGVSPLIRQLVCPILERFAAVPFFRPFILRFLVLFGCSTG